MDFKYDLRRISNKKQLLKFLSIDEEAFDWLTHFEPNQDNHHHPSGSIIPLNIPVFLLSTKFPRITLQGVSVLFGRFFHHQ